MSLPPMIVQTTQTALMFEQNNDSQVPPPRNNFEAKSQKHH